MVVTHRGGFTIVELMIVILVLTVLATLAIPNMVSSRMRANETSAIGILRTVCAAQAEFRTKNLADMDGDGAGEYGYFAEMSGYLPPRSSSVTVQPPILSSQFRTLDNGRVQHSGYFFRIFLPDAVGIGVAEAAGGGSPGGVDSDLAETTWCCYAWPSNSNSGERAFCVNQQGDIIGTNNLGAGQQYAGDVQPEADAAFVNAATNDSIIGILAVYTNGTDGGVWVAVQ